MTPKTTDQVLVITLRRAIDKAVEEDPRPEEIYAWARKTLQAFLRHPPAEPQGTVSVAQGALTWRLAQHR